MPNAYQKQLYSDLMDLTESLECFYFKDFELGNSIYRIFNYRLASYTDFLKPNALECRGHMFELDDGEMVRLASLPPEKFFNLNENPFTTNLDLSTIVSVEIKKDGSLTSSYVHPLHRSPNLRLKTKGSLSSSHSIEATKWLKERDDLYHEVRTLTLAGFTVNFEWCSPEPEHRIVLGYEEPHLTVLNIRDNRTGEYVDRDSLLVYNHPFIRNNWVDRIDDKNPEIFCAKIPEMENIEGFVVRLPSNQHVKIKTTWYLTRHYVKDSINAPRRLFEAVLEEATDDMRSLFHDDPVAIKLIEDMEQRVDKLYNHYVDIVERFYERNKELTRKDYAILGQKKLPGLAFPLAMNKYIGRDFSYKEWMKSHWKDFGIKDEIIEDV